MSEQVQLDQQQVVAASGNILRGVYAPVYLQKLAERGYKAANEKEAEELVELGFKLSEVSSQAQPNQVGQSKYASAVLALDGLSGGHNSVEEYQLKRAAAQLAQDPAIYASAMILQVAEKSNQ
jgi:hypothetical protein